MIIETESLKLARPLLGKIVELVIDRSLGSVHPQKGYVYPVNYGYVEGLIAPDGEGLDAYYLGSHEPLSVASGMCVAIVHRLNDDDDKLVVVSKEMEHISDEEILKAVHFQEQWFQPVILRI